MNTFYQQLHSTFSIFDSDSDLQAQSRFKLCLWFFLSQSNDNELYAAHWGQGSPVVLQYLSNGKLRHVAFQNCTYFYSVPNHQNSMSIFVFRFFCRVQQLNLLPTYLPTNLPTYLPTYLLTYLSTYLPKSDSD